VEARVSSNPCLACSINQGCCSDLKGLRLTPGEYETHFARHAQRLHIARDGPQYQVSSKDGPCPNWRGGCTVYEARPMECRLFPVTVTAVATIGPTVVAVASERTLCPQKAQLQPSDHDARTLIEGFLREAYGAHRPVRVVFDRGPGRVLALAVKAARRLTRPSA
jgi:hypothetical protein